MTEHDETVYIKHMLDAVASIENYVDGVNYNGFRESPLLQNALAYQIQIIGEAASRLTTQTKLAFPNVPWAEIVGMRHKIVHEYFALRLDVIWLTATRDVQQLRVTLQEVLTQLES